MGSIRQVEAVLFDFDGTLVDASEAICSAFNAALELRRVPPLPAGRIKPMIGRPLREMFAVADPAATPEQIDAYVDAYRAAWEPIAVPLSRPLPTMRETVAALTARGLRLGVVTSRISSGAVRILEAFGELERFGSIVGVEGVARPKPDGEAVLVACAELGVEPARAVMVGDTPDDVLAGLAAGARAVGITTGVFDASELARAGADRVIGRLAELLDLL